MIPEKATHEHEGTYYRKSGPSAYYWHSERRQWVYMKDAMAKAVLRKARRIA